MELRGIVEGFYGPPWTWDLRAEVATWCAARGMPDYVYAPKDDPKHRDRWADPYDADELLGFARMAELPGVRLGFAISPGLSIDADDAGDRRRLGAKVDQVVGVGAASQAFGLVPAAVAFAVLVALLAAAAFVALARTTATPT